MKKEQIYEKIDSLYTKDEKSKNFVLHLIRSYLPIDKIEKVWDKPTDLKKFKCAITGAKLISIGEIFEGIHSEEFKANFSANLKKQFETGEPMLADVVKGRILGYQGKETNTYMCEEAIGELFNWVSTKILQGDGKINWTMRQMQAKQFLGKFDKFGDDETKKQVNRIKQVVNKPATAKLSDNDVLQALKNKLEASEKK